jgi:hypothetical protein
MLNLPWNLGRCSLTATSNSFYVTIVKYIDAHIQLCGAARYETSTFEAHCSSADAARCTQDNGHVLLLTAVELTVTQGMKPP